MATYVLPQVLVFQDFTTQPAVAANPLSAHIAGGHAQLIRYANEDERKFGLIGLYDNLNDTVVDWPNRPAGAAVDQTYTKLFIENALLHYYSDPLSSGDTIEVAADYNNRIVAASTNFASNGAYARDADFYDRNVTVGDVIKVRGVPTGPDATGNPVTLWTYVKGLVADETPATVDAAVPYSTNATNTTTQATHSDGTLSGAGIAAVTNNYNGQAAGILTETYTIRVVSSSVNGDATTAELRVISASGTDDVASLTPSAFNSNTPIGSRGLSVRFTATAPGDNFIAGEECSVTVSQAFTKTDATSGGSYSATQDTTYVITVTKGGAFGTAEISVTTTNGIDQSGPTVVTDLGDEIVVGTKGVTITFSDSMTGLCKGDRFYIPVTGVSEGAIRTIVLGQNLDTTFASGDEVSVDLYIRKPALEVTANRTGMAPLTNWAQNETQLTINSGIIAYDSTWTDNGVALPLEVASSAALDYGVVYVEYRAWLATLINTVNSISDVANIDDISGPLDPENPLKWGVYKALTNSNGTPVLYTAVLNPDEPTTWDDVLQVLLSRDDAYELVPLTRNATVLGMYQAHVNSASSASEGLWRVTWFNLQGMPEIPIVSAGSNIPNHLEPTTTNGLPALATFSDDPFSAGDQYTICTVPDANSAFIANGVRPGDIVRALYTGDGFGNFTYTEFVVDQVQSENQLRLKTGPAAPQPVPSKIEVWRNLSATEEAVAIGMVAGAYNDRRVRATWPDRIESSGTSQEGYFLNCALAGLASGVLPQQGLTHVAINGFSSTQRTNDKFNKPQLDSMAVRGVWVVQQQLSGEIYTRHAVTTGDYVDINQREEMVTRNVDSISYRFKDYFAPFIGVSNVTPSMRDIILGGMDKLIRTLKTERTTPQLGGQLIDATVDRFYVSEIFKDRYVSYITLQVPYALNNIELHLVV